MILETSFSLIYDVYATGDKSIDNYMFKVHATGDSVVEAAFIKSKLTK
jgi:hypothetical protein